MRILILILFFNISVFSQNTYLNGLFKSSNGSYLMENIDTILDQFRGMGMTKISTNNNYFVGIVEGSNWSSALMHYKNANQYNKIQCKENYNNLSVKVAGVTANKIQMYHNYTEQIFVLPNSKKFGWMCTNSYMSWNNTALGDPEIMEINKNGIVTIAKLTVDYLISPLKFGNLTDSNPTASEILSAIGTRIIPPAGYNINIKDTTGTCKLYNFIYDGTNWNYTVMTKIL